MAIWTIKTHYKKSCEQHEHFYHRKIDGAKIIVKDGYRFAEFTIETTDDEFPNIEFTETPGGNGDTDSVDLFSLSGSNIDGTELVEMFDGGCWYDIEFEGLTLEQEEELQEFIDENSIYDLEDRDDSWYNDETEWWVWGPIEIKNNDGETVRIICADDDGNVIDFKED